MAETIELKETGAGATKLVAGQFRILSRLGAGGMGEVYLAEQLGLDRKVVLKVVHANLFANREEAGERFAREARALAQINHPNVVQLYAYGTSEDGPYFAMEFVDGRTLDEELRHGPLTERRALTIAAAVADAMAEAHEAGIIHRDLKPANVMLTVRHQDRDFVKVLDFGIAKLADRAEKKLTVTGAFFGTPQYVAPEQATGEPVTAATDIYALGTMLFEMLTGRPVFDAQTPFQVVQKHLSAAPDVPSSVAPGISAAADAIVLRCLEKSPAQRFPSAGELAAALRAAAAAAPPSPVTAAPAGATARLDTTAAPVLSRPHAQPSGTRVLAKASTAPAPVVAPPDPEPDEAPSRTTWAPPARRWYARWWSWLWPIAFVVAIQFYVGNLSMRRLRSLVSSVGLRVGGGTQTADPPPPSRRGSALGSAVVAGVRPDVGVDDTIAACLNRHSERAWNSYYRYVSWVRPAIGPTGHERNVYGVYTLYDTDACANAVGALPSGAAESTGLAHWLAAVQQVAKLTAIADPYYQAEDWKDDGMAKGKTMHRPLIESFEAFAKADRALRTRFDADAEARDRQALAADSATLANALVRLRLAGRSLVHLADVPWRRFASLDRGRFEDAAQETTRAAEAFSTQARALAGPAASVADKADELLVTMRHVRRRLGPHPSWSTGDRMNLDDQLAQWMVTGSPSQLVKSYDAFVGAVNDAHLAEGQEVTLVHLEPPLAD
jgi:serine/threonine-protein kinase